MVIRVVLVELFTSDDEVVSGGVLEYVDVLLGDEELLLAALHANEVNAELVDNRGLPAVERREAGNFGQVEAWKSSVHDQLVFALQFEKACVFICQY